MTLMELETGIRRMPIRAIHIFTLAYITIICWLCGHLEVTASNIVEDIEWEEGMKIPENHATEEERVALAITLEGEGGGLESLTELSGIGWAIINRVDSNEYPNDVVKVVSQKKQFGGYSKDGSYSERSYWMANDVLSRYEREKAGETDVGRTLPKDYLYFQGDGKHNYFSIERDGTPYTWSYVLSPYGT